MHFRGPGGETGEDESELIKQSVAYTGFWGWCRHFFYANLYLFYTIWRTQFCANFLFFWIISYKY